MISLNYKQLGQGSPLIILHGLFGSLDNWQSLGKRFADHHSVYLVDLRNHGRSPHCSTNSYEDMSEDIYFFMDEHSLQSASIIGHSMGGKVAACFALAYPDKVNKLLVADMGVKEYPSGHEMIFRAFHEVDPEAFNRRQQLDDALKVWINDFGVRQFLLKNISRHPDGSYYWRVNYQVLESEYPDILQKITADSQFQGETLFLRGEKSSYVKDEDLPRILDLFPKASLQTVPNAGHWLHAEQPNVFYEMVMNFLN